MGRRNTPPQRSQLPKNRREQYASFGFRHTLRASNSELYQFIDNVSDAFTPEKEPTIDARIVDPSRLSLKVVERYGLSNASRRAGRRLNKSEVGAIKQQVRMDLGPLVLDSLGFTIIFDRIVAVGDTRFNGERGKFALAPSIDQEHIETLLEEHRICMKALGRWGIPELRYPDAEWIPHLSIACSTGVAPRKLGTLVEEVLNDKKIAVNFDPLQYYAEKTESMV